MVLRKYPVGLGLGVGAFSQRLAGVHIAQVHGRIRLSYRVKYARCVAAEVSRNTDDARLAVPLLLALLACLLALLAIAQARPNNLASSRLVWPGCRYLVSYLSLASL
jgi:hypothetical protein